MLPTLVNQDYRYCQLPTVCFAFCVLHLVAFGVVGRMQGEAGREKREEPREERGCMLRMEHGCDGITYL